MTRDLGPALAQLDPGSARELVQLLVDVPSPTGGEIGVALALQGWLGRRGVAATVGPATEPVRLTVDAPPDGRDRLLLFGQLDTPFSGEPERDRLLLGERAGAPEFRAKATVEGDWVRGLGAENPKGYLAASVMALLALRQLGELAHVQVVAGFSGQGMPVLPDDTGGAEGFGIGCRSLLAALPPVHHAIVAKPGFAASHDEVGIAVFSVRVRGRVGYTGIRSYDASENTVAVAARVVLALEEWCATYGDAHTTRTTRPRGAVVAVRGGDPSRPAFWSEECELVVDLRLAPGADVDAATTDFTDEVERIGGALGARLVVERRVAVPGGATSEDAPVVLAAVRAWEELQGEPHQVRSGTSGYTDAAALRAAGVPTVRMGMPRPPAQGPVLFSMGALHVPSLLVLAEWLVRTVVELDAHP
jgi:acetylornithine deacetylase/succinyl-diaminopimelate desuccinylase-like protein